MFRFLILFILVSTVVNSKNNIKFSHLGINDSLPSTIVRQIIQDNDNMIWIATANGLVKYDGYELTIINDEDGNSLGDIWSIVVSSDGLLMIASINKGLYKYSQGVIQKTSIFPTNKEITSLYFDFHHRLWIGTTKSLFRYDNNELFHYKNIVNEKVYSFVSYDDKYTFMSTSQHVYKIDNENDTVNEVNICSKNNSKMYKLHKDIRGDIWLGKDDGLYLFNSAKACFENTGILESNVYSLASNENILWIGTLYDGMYRYNLSTKKLSHLKHDSEIQNGLSDNAILSIYFDQSNVMWLGTFYSGVDFLNLQNFDFKLTPNQDSHNDCSNIDIVHDILNSTQGDIWTATENGLVKIQNNKCTVYKNDKTNNQTISSNKLISLYQSNDSNIWVSNFDGGLDKINPISNKVERIGGEISNISFYFITEYKPDILLLGSFNKGLYSYDTSNGILNRINTQNSKINNLTFYNFALDNNGQYYFSTNQGIVVLKDDEMQFIKLEIPGIDQFDITSLSFAKDNSLWFSLNNQFLVKRDENENLEILNKYLFSDNQQINISSIVSVDSYMWLSSNKGIFKIDISSYQKIRYTEEDGALGGGYLVNSKWFDGSNHLIFGGKNGMVSFNTNNIKINQTPPNVILTSFNYFNERLEFGKSSETGFKLDKPVNDLNEIYLNYQDYIMGFEFSALDYADSMRNQYSYRLKGFNKNWVNVDADNRQATYTNLKPGEYTFQVNASNKDGIWSKIPKELKITVYPAPWLSPWAYFLYIVICLISIWGYIQYRIYSSRKKAQQLEITVSERTHEVIHQQKIVESLLEHKNEVFANITHEFKTPISLILGPTEQLLDEPTLFKHADKLSMIRRNSKRLMLMVGQILKLSQAELEKGVLREPQSVKSILLMLYEAFLPLAQDKNIDIQLENNQDVYIFATEECLEIVVGNLLSNALKFSNLGGLINISSTINNNDVVISIQDTGSGIKENDLNKIFERFSRLETHKNIAGTGIGLSVVKEITESNNGNVSVESQWGKGSLFKLIFPLYDLKSKNLNQIKNQRTELLDQMLDNTESELKAELPIEKESIQSNVIRNRVTILIIEDNLDMQIHIDNVLNNRFKCLFANRGRIGVAKALENIPDIVICDVMMPGMDGYQVTRILRHDSKTSHIPIILLTALNTKESRIKGWRENIDTYITKPFDELELNVQIDNILNIRKLLQSQTTEVINNKSTVDELDLPKKDLLFVEKLKEVIGKHYANEYFQKADLASKMAISERHLNRKIKALIDKTPLDMLRDYRLEMSTKKLKDGYQVGLVSDACGFSSVSYFGNCFKKRYGLTPKKYQMLNGKH